MIPIGKKKRGRLARRIRNARAAAEASNKQTKIEQVKTLLTAKFPDNASEIERYCADLEQEDDHVLSSTSDAERIREVRLIGQGCSGKIERPPEGFRRPVVALFARVARLSHLLVTVWPGSRCGRGRVTANRLTLS